MDEFESSMEERELQETRDRPRRSALRAAAAVLGYLERNPAITDVDVLPDRVTNLERWDGRFTLVDLLTDLRHWADAINFDFDHCLELSALHHEREVAERLETLVDSGTSTNEPRKGQS